MRFKNQVYANGVSEINESLLSKIIDITGNDLTFVQSNKKTSSPEDTINLRDGAKKISGACA